MPDMRWRIAILKGLAANVHKTEILSVRWVWICPFQYPNTQSKRLESSRAAHEFTDAEARACLIVRNLSVARVVLYGIDAHSCSSVILFPLSSDDMKEMS